jgi:plastocyanin
MQVRNRDLRPRSAGAGIVVLAAVIMLTGAACSSSSDTSGSSPSGGGGGGTATLAMKNFAFTPTTIDVHSGTTTITVTNNGSVQHSFTLDDGSVDQVVNPGQTLTVSVSLTADAAFHCRFHPTLMTGTLKVS